MLNQPATSKPHPNASMLPLRLARAGARLMLFIVLLLGAVLLSGALSTEAAQGDAPLAPRLPLSTAELHTANPGVGAVQAAWLQYASDETAAPTTTAAAIPLISQSALDFEEVTETLEPTLDGTISAGGLTLDFPAGAVAEETEVTIRPATILPLNAVDGVVYELEASDASGEVEHFAYPFAIRVSLEEVDLTGVDPDNLLLAASSDGSVWLSLPTEYDTDTNTVMARTSHFSLLALIVQNNLTAPAPIVLAEPTDAAPSNATLPFAVYEETVNVNFTEGTQVILSSTPDGQGELLTDDEVTLQIDGTTVYHHDYDEETPGIYEPTGPVDLTTFFAPGNNQVTLTITDTDGPITWTQGYLLVQPRNPYAPVLGAEGPTLLNMGIDLASGNYLRRETDMTISSQGLTISFERTYNSYDPTPGAFGYNWSSPYDSRATVYVDGSVEVRQPSGRRMLFTPSGTGYTAEPGVFNTLTASANEYILTQKASLIEFHYAKATGKLESIADPYGNTVDIAYENGVPTSLTDSAGRVYTFQTDTTGRITRITNEAEQHVDFEYDPLTGDLVKRIDRRDVEWTYEYDAAHRLVKVFDGQGNPIVLNTYDPVTGRLLSSTDGTQNTWQVIQTAPGVSEFRDANGVLVMTVQYDARFRPTTVYDASGTPTSYTYNDLDLVTSVTRLGLTTTYTYNEQGDLIGVVDASGQPTEISFNSLGRPEQVIDAIGAITKYSYDGVNLTGIDVDGILNLTLQHDDFGNITEIRNGAGQSLKFTYDEAGNVRTVTNGLDKVEQYFYDEDLGLLMKYIDAEGGITTYEYDENGNLTETHAPEDVNERNVYDDNGRLVEHYDALGSGWRYFYDEAGRLIKEIDPLDGETIYTYDERGNQVKVVDHGRTTLTTYNENNWPVEIKDAEDGITQLLHNELGQVYQIIDPNGNPTTLTYDPMGRVIKREDGEGHYEEFRYDGVGNLTDKWDANRNHYQYQYDGAGNLVLEIAPPPFNYETTYRYNLAGQVEYMKDPRGGETFYKYNEAGQLIEQIDPEGGMTVQTYTDSGDLKTIKDPNLHTTTFEYDGNHRVITLTDAAGGIQRFQYDPAGNLIIQTDANQHSTFFEYDKLYRQTTVTDAAGGITTYAYDPRGNLTRQTDAEEATTLYRYDRLDRLVEMENHYGGKTTFTYDRNGNQLTQTDPLTRTTTMVYDKANHLVKTIDPLEGETEFVYDNAGNLVLTVDPLERKTERQYDALNRLILVIDPLLGKSHYGYDEVGNVVSTTNANEQTLLYTYDRMGRLLTAEDALHGLTRYGYDAAGNRTRVTDANEHTTYTTYDEVNRPVLVKDPLLGLTEFEYDPVGNLIRQRNANGFDTFMMYDKVNRLIQTQDALDGKTFFAYDRMGRQTARVDANGHTTTFQYDKLGRLTHQTDPLTRITEFKYDAVGNLVEQIDPRLGHWLFAYDDLDRPIGQSDPLGNTTLYQYDAVGNQTTLTNPRGYETHYTYDALNRQTVVEDALHQKTYFFYDPIGNLTRTVDALGQETRYQYDELNRLTDVTDPLLGVTHRTYDQVGNLLSERNPNLATTQYRYDALNRLVRQIDALFGETTFAYDKVGNLTAQTDANLHTSHMKYDALNRLVEQKNPLGFSQFFAYDKVGNLSGETDRRGNSTVYHYDDANQLVKTIDALEGEQTYQYDANGNLTRQTDPNENPTFYIYDAANRLTDITDALGGLTHFNYDPNGNRLSVTDANLHTTRFEYDALDRVFKTVNALEAATQYTYDPLSRVTAMLDANGRTTRYGYDPLSRLTSVTDAMLGVTRYGYDPVGNLTTFTDANLKTTTYTYDVLNRATEQKDPLGAISQYAYDAVGNLTQRIDANGTKTSYAYDDANQRIATSYPDGSSVNFQYDRNGNLTSIANPSLTLMARYDELNRLTAIGPSVSPIGYTYDAASNLVSTKYPNGETVRYSYDDLNRQTSMTDPMGRITGYTYDAVGNLTQTDYPNAVRSTYQYDPANRLINLLHQRTTDNMLFYQNALNLDAVGNVRTMTERFTQGSVQTIEHTYQYDDLDRLLREVATPSWASGEKVERSYQYDPVGNRRSETVSRTKLSSNKSTTTSTSYQYDAANQLTQAGKTSFKYDANGNRIQAVSPMLVQQYGYDYENNLTSYQRLVPQNNGKLRQDISATYEYDGLDRRIAEHVTNNGISKVTRTRYDGFSYNPLVTSDTPGQTTNLYYGAGYLVASREIQSNGQGSIYYRQQNWRGDVALITNQSGGSVHSYFYTPYGDVVDNNAKLLDSSNFTGPHNPYTLTGKHLDYESGLTYFGARFYDAANGTWLNRDPLPGGVINPMEGLPTSSAFGGNISQVASALGMILTSAYSFTGISYGTPMPRRGDMRHPMMRNSSLFNMGNPLRYVDLIGASSWDFGINGCHHVPEAFRHLCTGGGAKPPNQPPAPTPTAPPTPGNGNTGGPPEPPICDSQPWLPPCHHPMPKPLPPSNIGQLCNNSYVAPYLSAANKEWCRAIRVENTRLREQREYEELIETAQDCKWSWSDECNQIAAKYRDQLITQFIQQQQANNAYINEFFGAVQAGRWSDVGMMVVEQVIRDRVDSFLFGPKLVLGWATAPIRIWNNEYPEYHQSLVGFRENTGGIRDVLYTGSMLTLDSFGFIAPIAAVVEQAAVNWVMADLRAGMSGFTLDAGAVATRSVVELPEVLNTQLGMLNAKFPNAYNAYATGQLKINPIASNTTVSQGIIVGDTVHIEIPINIQQAPGGAAVSLTHETVHAYQPAMTRLASEMQATTISYEVLNGDLSTLSNMEKMNAYSFFSDPEGFILESLTRSNQSPTDMTLPGILSGQATVEQIFGAFFKP